MAGRDRIRRNEMTRPAIEYARAADCFKSPDNVRTHSEPTADAELEANIAETGLVLENLIGVRVSRGAMKGKIEIYGGGRRLDAVMANIEKQILDADFMVPVLVVRGAKDAIEMSLTENYFQLPMNPADECCAFQAIIEREKKTPAELAKRFGKTEKFVLGRLRLASLAEPIFDALRTGEIGIEVAKAFASIADRARQERVFEQIRNSYDRGNVNEIRRQLASGSYCGADPKALLVGREAYEAAGGRFEHDLFSDASSEVWLDGEIVERLAEETLAAAAAALRERNGFAEVRALSATSVPYSMTCRLREVEPQQCPLSDELATRKSQIESELEQIERDVADEEDYTEEQAQRFTALAEELDGIIHQSRELTPAQKAGALAYLIIGEDGAPELHDAVFQLDTATPAGGGGDPDDAEAALGDGGEDDTEAGEDDGAESGPDTSIAYSNRLRDELAVMKTQMLALHIANDPAFALDLGTFIMAHEACTRGWTGMPSELRAMAPSPRVANFESTTAAARSWTDLEEALDRSWLEHDTIEQRYEAFCDLDDGARADWLGWSIARTIHAVPHGETGSSFIDILGARLRIDVAAWWRPTASNFFDRLTKPSMLNLFEEIGGVELRGRYAGSRKFDLALSAEKLFAGDVLADVEVKERARAWLPDPMRFAEKGKVPEAPGDDVADGANHGDEALSHSGPGGNDLADHDLADHDLADRDLAVEDRISAAVEPGDLTTDGATDGDEPVVRAA
ncbi:ParB/RepB/Spo0J family partition protein [Novosphingobium sp. BL-52-GroH]|uniref:ParB/RepB/Spo0J family partition protein n=1 Tax=Novosphingobium sp. BL-52-GroH TaxID=3349877 RepID=UPI00385144FD